ncbi:hypothetical protein PENSUB_13220 [Penicillium subrubescens]|uniref:Uncharacterized protein n=1 Tax=Penicillium subrubescens TaxID=1316194 RepID=A0A1Q5SSE3_9EURO|nr:hypothetical protein PENSUB_13220 [Penicillium subrubescens]
MDVKQRVLGRAGQVLGAAFKAQGQDLVLGSYTGAELSLPHDRSRKAPDFIATYQKSGSGIVTGVGEARLPAIRPHPPHPLGSALDKLEKGYEGSLRRLLGLVPTYLLETHIKYGFVTSYDETIFLRKVERNGVVRAYTRAL